METESRIGTGLKRNLSVDSKGTLSIIIPNYRERRLMEVYARIKWYFPKAQIILSDDTNGNGKGWSLREGFKKATGDLIVFLDGDMDVNPREIKKLLNKMDRYDIALGTKDISKIQFRRRILSFCSRKFIKWLFGLPIEDTQTGLKMFKRHALREWSMNGYAFDCEILLDAHLRGCTMCEVPIEVKVTDTKSMKDILKTLFEAIRIKYAHLISSK
jgi:glycosyltransferase involved in cell wall biosynthesis